MAAAVPGRRKKIGEPNPSGTSWTSMRWPSGQPGTGNVGYTKSRLLSAAAAQTSTRTLTASPIKPTNGSNSGDTSTDRHLIGSLRAKFGEAVSRTTAPIFSFTNKVNPSTSVKQKDFNTEPRTTNPPPRQIVKGTVVRMPPPKENLKSAATEEYAKALKRQTNKNELSTSTKASNNAAMPEVLSRFGSRNPAFLAGGVIRTVPITYTSSPARVELQQPTITLSRPIQRAERPWRKRIADSARLRNLEEDAEASSRTSNITTHQLTSKQSTTRGGPVINASTPTSSIALRNYESKFQNHKYNESPVSSRPTSLVLTPASSYLAAKYKPRNSVSGQPLSRNASTASTNMSLLSSMPTTSRFSPSTTKMYTPPILSRYPLGVSASRGYMSRSYTPSYVPRISISTTNYASGAYNRDEKKIGEGTKWRIVENPPPVYERKSRRDRSTSATRKRRSRSKTNEPPPPGSSSESEHDKERVPPRVRKLRKKPSNSAFVQQEKPTDIMPAAVGQFEAIGGDNGNSGFQRLADVNVIQQKTANEAADTSTSTPTNASEMVNFVEEPVDETKFNAVTSFKPAGLRAKRLKTSKQTKPVPGIWPANIDNEVTISQNKNFRRLSDHIIVEITMKHFPYAKASTAHFRMPRPRKQSLMFKPFAAIKKPQPLPPKIESKTISASFMRPKIQSLSTHVTFKNKKPSIGAMASLKAREPRPKLLRVTASSTIQKHLTNKQLTRQSIQKTISLKGKCSNKAVLNCKSTTDKGKNLALNIHRRPENRACNGTVKDEKDVVFARVESGFCMPVTVKVTLAQPPKIFSPTQQYDGLSSPEPYEPQLHVPIGRNDHQGGPLILPDRSILEEYVKRKRTHLESIRQKNRGFSSSENSFAESPPSNAINTELQAACPVRILEPHIQQALITTPTRSRVSSVEPNSSGREQSMTPRPNEAVVGGSLAAPLRQIHYNNPSLTVHGNAMQPISQQQLAPASQQQPVAAGFFRGVLRNVSDPSGGARLKFDTPKSPFEERMQQQANQLRKTSVGSSDTDNENTVKNRASIDGGMAQGFAAALAQQQPARHERYAAHIPVPSGRQSATSMDSSGALDTASRQLDQMIDQARYKHQQHRTKFKEAIDYLDQIFEDLKKECEPNSPPQLQRQNSLNRQSSVQSSDQLKPKPFPVGSQLRAQEKRLQKSVSQDAGSTMTIQKRPITQQKLASQTRVIQPQPPAHQQRLQGPIIASTQRHPLKKQRSNIEGTNDGRDIEVSETIVLPSKNTAERLDFTRQWVKNDIRGWIDKPANKQNRPITSPDQQLLVRQNSSGADSDEHSLGSCSAEVAAINIKSTPQQKTKKPQQVQPVKNIQNEPKSNAPVKPFAYRPQPQNNNQIGKNLPITVLNAPDTIGYELQKVPSQQDLPRSPTHESSERPGSQDYQSLGSANSQDPSRPNFYSNSLQRSVSGAFVQYPQRGSIQSLPDAVLVAVNGRVQGPGSSTTLQAEPSATSGYVSTLGGSSHHLNVPPDPPALKALMDELDMNTTTGFNLVDDSNPDDPEEKRRSFPTTQNDIALRNKITVQRPVPTRLGVPSQNYTGSIDRGITKMQQQIVNPFTNKVLGPQKSPPPQDPSRQQFEDAANLLDSVIDELAPRSPTHKQRQIPAHQRQPATTIRQQSLQNTTFVSMAHPQLSPAHHNKPFETINAEKMNPSRVETMHQMFEGRRNVPVRHSSINKESEPTYSEIGEFQREETQFKRAPSFKQNNNISSRPAFPSSQPPREYIPPPQSQPAINIQRVPSTSSRHQFRISTASNEYAGVPSSGNVHFDSQNDLIDDEEDGGFYDNLQNLNARAAAIESARTLPQVHPGAHFGQSFPQVTLAAPQPPPHKFLQSQQKGAGARIGQLIRKLGGVAERPIVQQTQQPHAHHLRVDGLASSGSVLSLNRIIQDNSPKRPGMLMKSNSLSHEPWRIHAMGTDLSNSTSNQSQDSKSGFNRLKQTIFGSSKKWLN